MKTCSVAKLESLFTWEHVPYDIYEVLKINNEIVAKRYEKCFSEHIRLTSQFFKYFKPVNFEATLCPFNSFLTIDVNGRHFEGFVELTNVMEISENEMVIHIETPAVRNKTKSNKVEKVIRRDWDMLENLATVYSKPLPTYKYLSKVIDSIVSNGRYDPLELLGALYLSDDPSERSAFMQDNKEAIIRKVLNSDSCVAPLRRIDVYNIEFSAEFMRI